MIARSAHRRNKQRWLGPTVMLRRHQAARLRHQCKATMAVEAIGAKPRNELGHFKPSSRTLAQRLMTLLGFEPRLSPIGVAQAA